MPKHSTNLTQQDVEKEDYQVISQKNLGNVAAQGENAKEYRKSLIDKKMQQNKSAAKLQKPGQTSSGMDNGQASSRKEQSSREKDLEAKIYKLEKERKELKYTIQKQSDDMDRKDKKIKELEEHV